MVTVHTGYESQTTGKDVLDALHKAGVFVVHKATDGRFFFEEACDHYNCAFLTKEQVLALADELRALACRP
jgi:hypothetical protein